MFQELLEKLQKPMTVEARAALLDDAVVAMLRDRAELERLATIQASVTRDMSKGYR